MVDAHLRSTQGACTLGNIFLQEYLGSLVNEKLPDAFSLLHGNAGNEWV